MEMARFDKSVKVSSAALAALVRLKSTAIVQVARIHIHDGRWFPARRDAWAASGEFGEEALCQAIAGAPDPNHVERDAISCLAQIGDRRSLGILKAMAKINSSAPETAGKKSEPANESVYEQAVRQIEARLKTGRPAPAKKPATKSGS